MKNRILSTVCMVILSILLGGQWLHQVQAHQHIGTSEHKPASQCNGSCRSVITDETKTELENVLPDEDPDPQYHPWLASPLALAYLTPVLFFVPWHIRWRPPDLIRLWGVYRL